MSFLKVAKITEILEVRDAECEVIPFEVQSHDFQYFLTKGEGTKVSEINQNVNTACVHCPAVKICLYYVLVWVKSYQFQ